MSSTMATSPTIGAYHSLRQFSVDEYHRMIETGILDETDKVELLEGFVVLKMPRNPPHVGTIQLVAKQVSLVLPAGWCSRIQSAITLIDSEPEPDVAVARGDERTYLTRHPSAADVGQLIEVADSSLDRERNDKLRIYARAAIPVYWIVNIVDGRIEVYTGPSGPGAKVGYAQRQDFDATMSVPLFLGGVMVATLAVRDLLP
jgi:Uma2 family endonuclease